jgi:hypothetical protein
MKIGAPAILRGENEIYVGLSRTAVCRYQKWRGIQAVDLMSKPETGLNAPDLMLEKMIRPNQELEEDSPDGGSHE